MALSCCHLATPTFVYDVFPNILRRLRLYRAYPRGLTVATINNSISEQMKLQMGGEAERSVFVLEMEGNNCLSTNVEDLSVYRCLLSAIYCLFDCVTDPNVYAQVQAYSIRNLQNSTKGVPYSVLYTLRRSISLEDLDLFSDDDGELSISDDDDDEDKEPTSSTPRPSAPVPPSPQPEDLTQQQPQEEPPLPEGEPPQQPPPPPTSPPVEKE